MEILKGIRRGSSSSLKCSCTHIIYKCMLFLLKSCVKKTNNHAFNCMHFALVRIFRESIHYIDVLTVLLQNYFRRTPKITHNHQEALWNCCCRFLKLKTFIINNVEFEIVVILWLSATLLSFRWPDEQIRLHVHIWCLGLEYFTIIATLKQLRVIKLCIYSNFHPFTKCYFLLFPSIVRLDFGFDFD